MKEKSATKQKSLLSFFNSPIKSHKTAETSLIGEENRINENASETNQRSVSRKEQVVLFDGCGWVVGRSWYDAFIAVESKKEYFKEIHRRVTAEKSPVFPPVEKLVFSWTLLCGFDAVRVVIIGQDPYHGLGQAHGLAFSVPPGVQPPPSLQNIFKELASDANLRVPFRVPSHGSLHRWAEQGVLLLNTSLTVCQNAAASHSAIGWQTFTDAAIEALCKKSTSPLVFMLWGSHAFKKEHIINRAATPHSAAHLILKAVHPLSFSAHRDFLGCKHFSLANDFLSSHQAVPIDWNLDEHTPK